MENRRFLIDVLGYSSLFVVFVVCNVLEARYGGRTALAASVLLLAPAGLLWLKVSRKYDAAA